MAVIEAKDITNFLGITKSKDDAREEFEVGKYNEDEERKVLHEWEAVSRAQQSFNTKLSKNMIVILVIIGLVLLAMQEFIIILLIASAAFLYYVLSATPPDNMHYTLTNHGVIYGEEFYYWDELRFFFYTEKGEVNYLCVDTLKSLPGRLYFSMVGADNKKIDQIFRKYLRFVEEEPKTIVDKMYESAMGKVELN